MTFVVVLVALWEICKMSAVKIKICQFSVSSGEIVRKSRQLNVLQLQNCLHNFDDFFFLKSPKWENKDQSIAG